MTSRAKRPAPSRELHGLLALLLGVFAAGCEDPADPSMSDARISRIVTPGSDAREGAVADPRDRILFEILAQRQAIGANAVARTCPETEADLIQALERAYGALNYNLFRPLLADAAQDNAEFLFYLAEPTSEETSWGLTEELRIHRRMFMPERTPPGETPLPPELWVQSIDIDLTQLEPFQERTDLYSENGGPLDPARWRASDARYGTSVYWDLQGETDYLVTGQANFVVIQDRERRACSSGRFLLWVWEDLGSPANAAAVMAVESVNWGSVKGLYR